MRMVTQHPPDEAEQPGRERCQRSDGGCQLPVDGGHSTPEGFLADVPPFCPCHPHPSRVQNALRDGDLAWLGDRRLAAELQRIAPRTVDALREQDWFTTRVVKSALAAGITQFLDLGSGHLHTSAAYAAVTRAAGGGRRPTIVSVDHDFLVDTHNHGVLTDDPLGTARTPNVIRGNALAVGQLLRHLASKNLLDLRQRICVLMIDLLHYADPATTIRPALTRLRTRLVPGSWIAATHLVTAPLLWSVPDEVRETLRIDTERWRQAYQRCSPPHLRPCLPSEFTRLFTLFDQVAAGVTTPGRWPLADNTAHPRAPFSLAVVARVPEHPTDPTTAA